MMMANFVSRVTVSVILKTKISPWLERVNPQNNYQSDSPQPALHDGIMGLVKRALGADSIFWATIADPMVEVSSDGRGCANLCRNFRFL